MSQGRPSRAVLITGCSSGIGRATARRLASAGWPVFATARRSEHLADLERLGCRMRALDVTDAASMERTVDEIEGEFGAVGALINNAGYGESGAVEEVDPARVRRQFETNVFGLLRLTQLVLPGMRAQRWGRIVNVSSMGGKLTFPGGGVYHASKHAIEALSDALRFEVQGFGIDVVVIEPGLIRTEFGERAAATMGPVDGPYGAFHRAVARATIESYRQGPLARLAGEPDDVARAIERALAARRPRTRYTVSASAKVLLTLRRLLPDRWWDAFLRGTYPQPGRQDREKH